MGLFVIVLCLLSERFLVHKLSCHRTGIFLQYTRLILPYLARMQWLNNNWLVLGILVGLPCLVLALILYFFCHALYGVVLFFINLLIFYYCLGPENIFYPESSEYEQDSDPEKKHITNLFAKANTQAFAVIFWYILLGPVFLLLYRFVTMARKIEHVSLPAEILSDFLEWLPARLCGFFYLLVGNFQVGFPFYIKNFFGKPIQNRDFLGQTGLYALKTGAEGEDVTLSYALHLIEYAVIIFLVLIALFYFIY